MTNQRVHAYQLAQRALADMKTAVLSILSNEQTGGLSNAEIGRSLGIYEGHRGHEGHMSRTILARLEEEGLVAQHAESKRWQARVSHRGDSHVDED